MIKRIKTKRGNAESLPSQPAEQNSQRRKGRVKRNPYGNGMWKRREVK